MRFTSLLILVIFGVLFSAKVFGFSGVSWWLVFSPLIITVVIVVAFLTLVAILRALETEEEKLAREARDFFRK